MFTVPAAADEMPVPEPVDAVVMETLGHCFWMSAVHELNRGYNRLEPVSWRATGLVGQFSRLESETAAVVVVVEAVVVEVLALGEELHAARRTADAATTDITVTPPRRRARCLGVPGVGDAEGRVDMTDGAPFHGNDEVSVGNAWSHRRACAGSQPSAGGHPILPLT